METRPEKAPETAAAPAFGYGVMRAVAREEGFMDYQAFERASVGFAYHRIVLDDGGQPCDYVFLEANRAFESMTGLRRGDLLGRRVTEVMPDIRSEQVDFVAEFGAIALSGGEKEFDAYVDGLGRYYRIFVYSPEPMHFWVNFTDITEERIREEEYRLLFERSSEAIVVERDDMIRLCNGMTERITGFTQEELLGRPFTDLADERDQALAFRYRDRRRTQDSAEITTFRIQTKSAGVRYVEMKAERQSMLRGEETVIFFHDVTARMETEEQLKAREEQFRLLFKNASEAILVIQDNRVQLANAAAETYAGYSAEEMAGRPFLEFIHHEDRERVAVYYYKRLNGILDADSKTEFRICRKTGDPIWVQCSGVQIQWKGRQAVQYFMIDIDERKKVEEEIHSSEEKYRLITEFVSDMIWVFNYSNYRMSYFSPTVQTVTGYTPEEAAALSIDTLVSPASLSRLMGKVNELAGTFLENPGDSSSFLLELQMRRKEGELVWTETSCRLRENASHEIEVIGVSRNIEERKRAEQQILYLSYHDQLTGLYNRRYYDDQLRYVDEHGLFPITLVLFDVNGLKLTNDVFGHQAGDRLLVRVAEGLKAACRARDVAARIGGDEFVLLLPQTNAKTAEKIIRRVRQEIYGQMEDSVILSVSFGWSTKEGNEKSINALFLEAENRMYLRKLTESVSMRNETIKLITNSLYQDQPEEAQHSVQVSMLCGELAKALDMDENQISELSAAGLLHDIGKIGIDSILLNKKGELTPAERATVRQHPEKGYHILKETTEFMSLSEFVLCHHERMDGKGYPRGLSGNEIPIQSRIISVCEAFDVMTSDRHYHNKLTAEQAAAELKKNAGTQFDRRVVRAFVEKVLLLRWE